MYLGVRKQYQVPFNWQSFAKNSAYIVLFIILGLGLIKLATTQYFPIHHVKIYGNTHTEREEVKALIAPLVTNGFFGIDVGRIQDRLLRLPWVSKVVVTRAWPDEVVINIQEKQPVALWNESSILSANGELFAPKTPSYPQDLPQLVGPDGEQIVMSQYYAKMSSLLSPLNFKIKRLELSPGMTWSLVLDNGVKLTIGHKDILTRLNHFVKVYPKIVGERVNEVDYIDLRYPNGIAVRWKSIT